MTATSSPTIGEKLRRPLSTLDRSILALHGLAAGIVGVIAFLGANDPDWGDLQRIVILMLIGLWVAGIVAMSFVVRLVKSQWIRTAILLGGPFIGIVLLVGQSMLG